MPRLTKLLAITLLAVPVWAQHPKRTVVLTSGPLPKPYNYSSPTKPLFLKDPAGVCWSVVVLDGGSLQIAKTTNSCAGPMFVASYPDQVGYQVGIDSLGHLQFSGVPFSTNYASEMFFLSSPTLTRDALYFRNGVLFLGTTVGQ